MVAIEDKRPGSRRPWWRSRFIVCLLIAVTLIAAATGWVIGRFRITQLQREIDRLASSRGGGVGYDYFCDESGRTSSAPWIPPGPAWLRKYLGDDFFSDVVSVGIYADPSDRLMCKIGSLRRLRRLIVVNYSVREETDANGQKVTVYDPVTSPITDDGLACLKHLSEMRILELHKSQITDAGLVHLGRMSELRELDIGWATVSGKGLAHLHGLAQLEKLELYCTPLSDRDLPILRQFSKLKRLNLSMTKITDAGLPVLSTLHHLEDLRLVGTSISDAGIEDLKKIPQLRKLAVRQTKITARGVQQLKAALPGCKIECDE